MMGVCVPPPQDFVQLLNPITFQLKIRLRPARELLDELVSSIPDLNRPSLLSSDISFSSDSDTMGSMYSYFTPVLLADLVKT